MRKEGSDSFFRSPRRQNARVMTPEKVAECQGLFAGGMSVPDVAKHVGIGESTIRKAIGRGVVLKKKALKGPPKMSK